MSSLNKVMLIGNLGKDPDVRTMNNGNQVASFSMAMSESWKDKGGERREKTEWANVVIFSEGLVKVVSSYLKKGSKCYVEGKLQTRKWTDATGQEKYTTEVILQGFDAKLVLLDGKPQGESGGYERTQSRAAPAASDDAWPDDSIPFMWAAALPLAGSLMAAIGFASTLPLA